jgi:hypothetical protein
MPKYRKKEEGLVLFFPRFTIKIVPSPLKVK